MTDKKRIIKRQKWIVGIVLVSMVLLLTGIVYYYYSQKPAGVVVTMSGKQEKYEPGEGEEYYRRHYQTNWSLDQELTDLSQLQMDASSSSLIFLLAYSKGCGHCQRMHHAWDRLVKRYDNSTTPNGITLRFYTICPTNPLARTVHQTYPIDGYPTLFYFANISNPSTPQQGEVNRPYTEESIDAFIREQLQGSRLS
jgi:thiol-disulfide isomerase/thioredoxin